MRRLAFFKQLLQAFGQDKVGQLSAAFAYVATFSIAPLLLVLISISGFIFGEKAAQGQLFTSLASTVGASTAKTIQDVVAHTHQSGSGGLALVAGTVGMLLAAAGLTSQLQNSFNQIFQVVPDPKGGIKRTIYVKLKNIVLILIGGVAVAASVVISALINGLGSKVQQQIGIPPFALELINTGVSLFLFAVLLYLAYRVLPDVRIPHRVAFSASLVVAGLFLVGKIILAIIIGRNGTASAYGAAASLVTLLLWIYYSGQILFLGAEGIKVYGERQSLTYAPKRYNLKRTTLTLDSDAYSGTVVASFLRGFRKRSGK